MAYGDSFDAEYLKAFDNIFFKFGLQIRCVIASKVEAFKLKK